MTSLYLRNRYCRCQRCLAGGMMGPVVLVTLGLLFLIQQNTRWDFDQLWPILLIAIGGMLIAKRSASTAGHIQPNLNPVAQQFVNAATARYNATHPQAAQPTSAQETGESEVGRG